MKRTNSGPISCLLAASLCSTGFGHGVLLSSSSGFLGCCGHRLVSLKRGPELFSEKFGLLTVEYFFKLSHGVLHYKLSIERLRFIPFITGAECTTDEKANLLHQVSVDTFV
jgi:hypothetical protein